MTNETRENILRAAIKIFAEKGYRAATVREIGKAAGAGNLSAITYHFKGKENLYKAVLEYMFEDANRFIPKDISAAETPEEKLRLFILGYMRILYVMDTELDADFAAIFSKEVTHPSPFLTEMVQKYFSPGDEELRDILLEITGKRTPVAVIRKCEDSIMGQIYYQLFAWQLIVRSHPDHPAPHTQIEQTAHHIFEFSLGGLKKIKETL